MRARRSFRHSAPGARVRPAVALLALLVSGVPQASADHRQGAPGQAARPTAATTDLDALMARVLANRDQSWRRLQEYLLSERETFRLVAPDGSPMYGGDREYLWVARDGRAVRSPVRIDGVAVSDAARREAEARWERDEEQRAAKAETRRQAAAASGAPTDMEAMRTGEPRFISEVQFLRFKFEPGNYYFVGRETLAGREVLRIEYYPTRLFADDFEDGRREREEARRKAEAEGREAREVSADDRRIEQALNKVTLVTLWVDPAVAQVVRYTFDNVDFNFLPGRSLVRVDAARATMTMGQPFPDVWLPESLIVQGGITLATGSYRAEYARRFRDYRQADVQMRFRVKDDK